MSEYLTEEIVEFLYGHNTSGYSLRQKRKKTMESDYENRLQAVKKISECVKSFEDGCNEEIDTILEKIMDIASAALAKHRRNCDVGTEPGRKHGMTWNAFLRKVNESVSGLSSGDVSLSFRLPDGKTIVNFNDVDVLLSSDSSGSLEMVINLKEGK